MQYLVSFLVCNNLAEEEKADCFTHMFWLRNKKIIFSYALLSVGLQHCGNSVTYEYVKYKKK